MPSTYRNYNGIEIKRCPFCDGIAMLETKSKTMIKGELRYTTYVRCTRCDSRGKRILLDYREPESGVVGARYEAVEAWNTRIEQ